MSQDERNLRLPAVRKISGLSTSTIWRLEREGLFPKRRKIGKRAVGWLLSDVNAWVASKAEIEGGRNHA